MATKTFNSISIDRQLKNLEKQLHEIKEILAEENDDLLNVKEAAIFLKFETAYIYRLINQNKIPYYKPNGGKVLFSKRGLRKWVLEHKFKSKQEIQDEANEYLKKGGVSV